MLSSLRMCGNLQKNMFKNPAKHAEGSKTHSGKVMCHEVTNGTTKTQLTARRQQRKYTAPVHFSFIFLSINPRQGNQAFKPPNGSRKWCKPAKFQPETEKITHSRAIALNFTFIPAKPRLSTEPRGAHLGFPPEKSPGLCITMSLPNALPR